MMTVKVFELSDSVYPAKRESIEGFLNTHAKTWGTESFFTFATNIKSLKASKMFQENRCRCFTQDELREILETGCVKGLAIRTNIKPQAKNEDTGYKVEIDSSSTCRGGTVVINGESVLWTN